MSALSRNNVKVKGSPDAPPMFFAHGYGCDQNMWRLVAPAFERDHRLVLFDHVGAGRSDHAAFCPAKYGSLEGYADDIIEIGRALGVKGAVFVGHSVSAMMGVIAAIKAPELFSRLVLVAPSPCYINEGDYHGGFTREEIGELLDSLDKNHLGWSAAMAPVIMGNPDRKELAEELTESFCRTDPKIARHFARTTFLSDERALLERVNLPTLILQCSDDVIAPRSIGDYMHGRMPFGKLVVMKATGHCPNLSAPEETTAAIRAFLS
ncbi:MAG: alpha/beta hydrolase [Verrucomicrobiaceae bacterium]|nr:MAG: alpha/beta hydrolase [Verrucomicrobiaceae bacterium]